MSILMFTTLCITVNADDLDNPEDPNVPVEVIKEEETTQTPVNETGEVKDKDTTETTSPEESTEEVETPTETPSETGDKQEDQDTTSEVGEDVKQEETPSEEKNGRSFTKRN